MSAERISRDQVVAAKEALGLDPDLTVSVAMYRENVFIERVRVVDGTPLLRDGLAVTERIQVDITGREED